MPLTGKKLGILVSTAPDHASFQHGLGLAEAALNAGTQVYLYCIDAAILGVNDQRLQSLRARGLNLFACAYAAQRRRLPLGETAVFSGLSVLNELIAGTDRFVSFN